MARWISMELAARLGVSAGLEFSFPNDLLDRSFTAILPASYSSATFTQSSLTWRIAAQLPDLARQKGFEQIAAYLGDGHDDRRLAADFPLHSQLLRPIYHLPSGNGPCAGTMVTTMIGKRSYGAQSIATAGGVTGPRC